MEREALLQEQVRLKVEYEAFQSRALKLDMSRGKPGGDQLDLSDELLEMKVPAKADGMDLRNYGALDGLPSAKELFAQYLEVAPSEILIGGNSSLSLMFYAILWAMIKGVCGGKPWSQQGTVKFLCPTPGYDRHFAVTEYFGIEMIPVENSDTDLNMEEIERLAGSDSAIKGIWCVPKYSNPQGLTYSDDTVRRLAGMKTAADDFRIMWDNAYTAHHLTDQPDQLLNILEECKRAGNPERVYLFGSTSKITYSGSGVAVMGGSEKNIAYFKQNLGKATIGPDKLNIQRHVMFLKDMDHIREQMKKQAALIAPKFQLVFTMLEKELGGTGIASWSKPRGGYFISFNAMDGCAKRIVSLCKEAGVTLTGAGAAYPYGRDPRDRNIRIAPTYPPIEELELAMELFCICVKLVSIEKLLDR